MKPAESTNFIWNIFNAFDDKALDVLLETVNIAPIVNREYKLQQVMEVWFGGTIPDMKEFERLNKLVLAENVIPVKFR